MQRRKNVKRYLVTSTEKRGGVRVRDTSVWPVLILSTSSSHPLFSLKWHNYHHISPPPNTNKFIFPHENQEISSLNLMALASAPVMSFRQTGVRPCAATGKGQKSGGNKQSNWWSPIFGWSNEPDYIEKATQNIGSARETVHVDVDRDEDRRGRGSNGRFAAFTEEKARQLRIKTIETSNFHDVMYHSAIASRLASDFHTVISEDAGNR